jgi:hypothetical protein
MNNEPPIFLVSQIGNVSLLPLLEQKIDFKKIICCSLDMRYTKKKHVWWLGENGTEYRYLRSPEHMQYAQCSIHLLYVHVHLCGFIDPSPTKQEVKWESQAEWREPSQRESKEAGGVQDPKLLRRGGSESERESKEAGGVQDPKLKRERSIRV